MEENEVGSVSPGWPRDIVDEVGVPQQTLEEIAAQLLCPGTLGERSLIRLAEILTTQLPQESANEKPLSDLDIKIRSSRLLIAALTRQRLR